MQRNNVGGMQTGRENADESDFVDSFFLPGGILDPDDLTVPEEVTKSLATPLREGGASPLAGVFGLSSIPVVSGYSPWGSGLVAVGPSPLRSATGTPLSLPLSRTQTPPTIQGSPLLSEGAVSGLNAESSNFVPASSHQSWITSSANSPSLPRAPAIPRSSPNLPPSASRTTHSPVVAPPGFESSVLQTKNDWSVVAAASSFTGGSVDTKISYESCVDDRIVENQSDNRKVGGVRRHRSSTEVQGKLIANKEAGLLQRSRIESVDNHANNTLPAMNGRHTEVHVNSHVNSRNDSKELHLSSKELTTGTIQKSLCAVLVSEITSKQESSQYVVPDFDGTISGTSKEALKFSSKEVVPAVSTGMLVPRESSQSKALDKNHILIGGESVVPPHQEETNISLQREVLVSNNSSESVKSVEVIGEKVINESFNQERSQSDTTDNVEASQFHQQIGSCVTRTTQSHKKQDVVGKTKLPISVERTPNSLESSTLQFQSDIHVVQEEQLNKKSRMEVDHTFDFMKLFVTVGMNIRSLSERFSNLYFHGLVPFTQRVIAFGLSIVTVLFQSCLILVLAVANVFNFAADEATSHVVWGIFWGSPSVLCYYVFCLMPIFCNWLMAYVGNLPNFTPHLLSNLAVYHACRVLSQVSTDSSSSRRKSSKKFFSFATSSVNNTASHSISLSQHQNSDRFGNELCQSMLRLVGVALPIIFIVEGFNQSNSSFMLFAAHKRMILAYMMSLFKRGLIISPVAWVGWSVQVLLSTYLPAGFLLNSLQFFLGLAFIRLVNLLQIEGHSTYTKV